jgi:hypothetical protein
MRVKVSIGVAAFFSFILFFLGVFGPGLFEPWKNVLTDMHCESDETLIRQDSQRYEETHLEYFCQDRVGHKRDVTGLVIMSSCGLSLLFWPGLALVFVLLSFLFIRKSSVAASPSQPFNSARAHPSVTSGNLAVCKANMPLVTRLQQLQEALNQGLILQDEYEHNRHVILNQMHD